MKRVLIRLAIAISILIPIALVYAGVNIYNGIDDAYAQWGAADMVIDYMRDHDGKGRTNACRMAISLANRGPSHTA